MAQVVWTEPAEVSFNAIADFLALENPEAARAFIKRISVAVKQLGRFPRSGSCLPEWPRSPYRHLVVPPCRIIYRQSETHLVILFIMRQERLFRRGFLV